MAETQTAAEKKAAEEQAAAEKAQEKQAKIDHQAATDQATITAVGAVLSAYDRAAGNGATHTIAEDEAIAQLRLAFDWKPAPIAEPE